MSTTLTVLAALAAFGGFVVSLAAVAFALVALLRPQRDVERLASRVRDLGSLRVEWENTLTQLDSMNKRAARLARAEPPPPAPAAAAAGNGASPDARRRTLTLAEVHGRKEA